MTEFGVFSVHLGVFGVHLCADILSLFLYFPLQTAKTYGNIIV